MPWMMEVSEAYSDKGIYSQLTLDDIGVTEEDVPRVLGALHQSMNLPEDKWALIEQVLTHYGSMSQDILVFLTHSQLPWNEVRKGVQPFAYSDQKISFKSMYDYYSQVVRQRVLFSNLRILSIRPTFPLRLCVIFPKHVQIRRIKNIMSPSDTIASIALIISALMMIASFLTIYFSNRASNNTQRITLRLDFSHRYQEIMLAMPDSDNPETIKKYVLLYFDLCSEEYRLWMLGDGIVDSKTWHNWEDGMKDLLRANPTYRAMWYASKENYKSQSDTPHNNFFNFFDSLVRDLDC